jgi:aquaporin Z
MNLVKKSIAEFIGTFVLVFVACGVAALTGGSVVATALAFGLALIAMAYSIGRISGCHINPAVSLGMFLKDIMNHTPAEKKFGWKDLLCYIVAQILGGFVGALAIFGIAKMANISLLGNACNTAIGYDGTADSITAGGVWGALLLEVILTFIFVYLILNVTDERSKMGNWAGLLIGLTLTAVHLVGIPLDGTSVNPARSLATALAAAIFNDGDTLPLQMVYIFIIGPLLGAVLAAVVFHFLHKEKGEEPVQREAE